MIQKLTPDEIKKEFKQLLKVEKEMKAQSDNDGYYPLQEQLKKELRDFIREDFSSLKSKEILKVCSLVNSHRPVALHTFLIYCASLIND